MTLQSARGLLLMTGDGGLPETYTAVGAARLVALEVANKPVDATLLGSAGALSFAAGAQDVRVSLEGLFRDQAAEETLRAAAFGRTAGNYKIQFPNGDHYVAAFIVRDYARGGGADGLETFSVTLQRTGGGVYTPAT